MKYATLGSRFLLGLIFFVFGLNGFLNFIPVPPMPEGPAQLMGAFVQSGYMLPTIKATEVVGGLLLLSGFFVPLALVVLAPITINILLFHIFLTPGADSVMSIVMVLLHILAALGVWEKFKPILQAK